MADRENTMVQANFRLTPQQEEAIEAEIDRGRFPTASEALRHAVNETFLNGGASQKKAKEAGD